METSAGICIDRGLAVDCEKAVPLISSAPTLVRGTDHIGPMHIPDIMPPKVAVPQPSTTARMMVETVSAAMPPRKQISARIECQASARWRSV